MPGSDPTLPIEPHSMTGRRHLEFLLLDWLGNPAWMWLGFVSIVGVLLALDLGVLHRKQKEIGVRESLVLSAGYIVLGVSFAGLVWLQLGETAGIQYLTGFVVEKSQPRCGRELPTADAPGERPGHRRGRPARPSCRRAVRQESAPRRECRGRRSATCSAIALP